MIASSKDNRLPKLRPLDLRPIVQEGREVILLRDPLNLSENVIAVPRQLVAALALCDGTRDRAQLRSDLVAQYQLLVGTEVLDHLIEALDAALLLENERSDAARDEVLAAYRSAPCRPPALAGQSYPADPNELRQMLAGYRNGATGPDPAKTAHFAGRGLVSPHIDYQRGGPVYAAVWGRGAEMVRDADLAIVLGTDHYSERNLLTLTRQNYATPFGILPTAHSIVDELAAALGREDAFAGELHHRNEHSIELATVWLHYVRHGRPCEMVPVLCGGYSKYVSGETDLEHDTTLNAAIDVLQRRIAGRKAIVVAAGDLSHVGPAFGGQPVGLMERARLRVADTEIIERTCAGDAQGFFAAIQRADDRNNVCGLPPIYLALRILGTTRGEQVAYDRCPADEQNTSFVTVAGILLE